MPGKNQVQKRCRCGNCKFRKKTNVLGHPQDLESMKENYNKAKRSAMVSYF